MSWSATTMKQCESAISRAQALLGGHRPRFFIPARFARRRLRPGSGLPGHQGRRGAAVGGADELVRAPVAHPAGARAPVARLHGPLDGPPQRLYLPLGGPQVCLVGLVPQDLALFDELTAQANLQLFAALYDLGRKADADRILFPMLKNYGDCGFEGKDAKGKSYDWRRWDGTPMGYEGLLTDNYYALLAVPLRQTETPWQGGFRPTTTLS